MVKWKNQDAERFTQYVTIQGSNIFKRMTFTV